MFKLERTERLISIGDQERRNDPAKSPRHHRVSPVKPRPNTFDCQWQGCQARLHNLDTLKAHLTARHCRLTADGTYECRWLDCHLHLVNELDDHTITAPSFASTADWHAHLWRHHIDQVAWALGDGPSAGTYAQIQRAAEALQETFQVVLKSPKDPERKYNVMAEGPNCDLQSTSMAQAWAKKKGRHSSVPDSADEAKKEQADVPLVKKRGRGRPRKRPISVDGQAIDAGVLPSGRQELGRATLPPSHTEVQGSNAERIVVVKRGRGRPPKHKPPAAVLAMAPSTPNIAERVAGPAAQHKSNPQASNIRAASEAFSKSDAALSKNARRRLE